MNLAARIESLTVTFNGRKVLKDINLDVRRDELTLFIGRSGSGKTTLLRAMNRLNECFSGCATAGRVWLELKAGTLDAYGRETEVEALRRKVGMVFQTPNVLPVSLEKNLLLPLRLVKGMVGAAARERMEQALAEAELLHEVKDRLGQDARDLSGGQQQRLCLARALALDPEILLLDEPTASLDFQSASRIEALLRRLQRRYALVVVSHSLPQARRLGDRVVLLRDGELVDQWSGGELDGTFTLEALVEETF